MQAVILAAGVSSRLSSVTNGKPKCLVKVGGRSLLEHQVTTLRQCGVNEVIIVTGYCKLTLEREAPAGCRFVHNPHYATTNSLYSLSCVIDEISGPFILMNGDVFAHPEIYRRVAYVSGTLLAMDSSSGHDAEHMKIHLSRGLVRGITKSLAQDLVDGENVGIIKFCADGARAMLAAARDIARHETGRNTWAPAAVDRIASEMPVGAVDVADLPWVEIDFPADLVHAHEVIWPAINGMRTRKRLRA